MAMETKIAAAAATFARPHQTPTPTMYKLLNVLGFNSSRKQMSVIVKDEVSKILLFCKGADRLGKNVLEFEEKTLEHVQEYADAFLRTLILAYCELDEEAYREFNEKLSQANNSVHTDQETLIDKVSDKIERNLILLGATAVKDKLQNGVPDCIDKLA